MVCNNGIVNVGSGGDCGVCNNGIVNVGNGM